MQQLDETHRHQTLLDSAIYRETFPYLGGEQLLKAKQSIFLLHSNSWTISDFEHHILIIFLTRYDTNQAKK